MRIALAQINTCLGDFSSNRKRILEDCQRALDRRCDLVVFPEFALFGYHPADLLERVSVVKEQLKQFEKLRRQIPKGIAVVVGMVRLNPDKNGKSFLNSGALLEKGKKPQFADKELLPAYDVFDEGRHIARGNLAKNVVRYKGKKILITICEDIWGWDVPGLAKHYKGNPLKKLKGQKLDVILNLSASPFTLEKHSQRKILAKKTALFLKAPIVYVNLVGAQDELIFDGGSFALDKKGRGLAESVYFSEDLNVVDFTRKEGGFRQPLPEKTERLRQALVLGIRDFVEKTGFEKVHLGLSGGIDSAVVAALATDALGNGRVTGFALPGPFSSAKSFKLAEKLARNLKIDFKKFEISKTYKNLVRDFEKLYGPFKFGLVHENLQARLRGLVLMVHANKEFSLLLTTGNKSEYATGYTTLYGDMCGGLAPLADLLKHQVYDLADLYNSEFQLIPPEIIKRPPSAELRPRQKDQDTLPAYSILDKSVRSLVEGKRSARSQVENWTLSALMKSEHKRWQAPPHS